MAHAAVRPRPANVGQFSSPRAGGTTWTPHRPHKFAQLLQIPTCPRAGHFSHEDPPCWGRRRGATLASTTSAMDDGQRHVEQLRAGRRRIGTSMACFGFDPRASRRAVDTQVKQKPSLRAHKMLQLAIPSAQRPGNTRAHCMRVCFFVRASRTLRYVVWAGLNVARPTCIWLRERHGAPQPANLRK